MNSFAAVVAFASVTLALPQNYQSVTFHSPHPGHPAGGHPGHHFQSGAPPHVTPHHVTPRPPHHVTHRPPYHGPQHPSPLYPSGHRYATSPYSRPHVAAHAPVVHTHPHVSVARIPAHVPAVPHVQVAPHIPARAPAQAAQLTPSRSAAPTIDTTFGSFPNQGITPEQRATYLPVMKALLKVMETNRNSAQDINTLMVLTRDLSNKVPKDQDLLGNLGNFGNFGIDNLESMGIPATGDVIVDVDGVTHIRTEFGTFPLSDNSLMTDEERAQFLPVVRTFTKALEKGSTDPNESRLLMQQAQELSKLIPGNFRNIIENLTDGVTNNF